MLSHPRTVAACSAAFAIAITSTAAHGQELPQLPPPPPPPYAGTPPPAPPPPPPSPPAHMDQVRFEPDQPGLTLLQRSGEVPVTRVGGYPYFVWLERGFAPVYTPLCPGPGACTLQMPSGPYRLALAKNGGRAVPAPEPVLIRGPASIHGHYVDHSGLRAGGIALSIGGTIAGVVMIVLAADTQDACDASGFCYRHTVMNAPLTIGGIGVLAGSLIVGSVMASQRDEAHLMVTPLISWSRPEQAIRANAALTPTMEGAALTLRF